MPLYPLAGTIVVTGRTETGDVTALDDDLVQHATAVAQTVRETLADWRARPPASNDAAMALSSHMGTHLSMGLGGAPFHG